MYMTAKPTHILMTDLRLKSTHCILARVRLDMMTQAMMTSLLLDLRSGKHDDGSVQI